MLAIKTWSFVYITYILDSVRCSTLGGVLCSHKIPLNTDSLFLFVILIHSIILVICSTFHIIAFCWTINIKSMFACFSISCFGQNTLSVYDPNALNLHCSSSWLFIYYSSIVWTIFLWIDDIDWFSLVRNRFSIYSFINELLLILYIEEFVTGNISTTPPGTSWIRYCSSSHWLYLWWPLSLLLLSCQYARWCEIIFLYTVCQ